MIPCTYCGGIGTVGGSFPGTFGPYVPGETCPICHGSGKEDVGYVTPEFVPRDPPGTTLDWFADGHIEKRTS